MRQVRNQTGANAECRVRAVSGPITVENFEWLLAKVRRPEVTDAVAYYAEVMKQRDALRELLAQHKELLAWAMDIVERSLYANPYRVCGNCGRMQDRGHTPDCPAGKALKLVKGGEDDQEAAT